MLSTVHIVRHGEGIHNVQRGYPHRDAPLTEAGVHDAAKITSKLAATPDIILISPMTRALQTAMSMIPSLSDVGGPDIPVQIWPDLREANNAIITHRGFIAFLVQGRRFELCETRSYRFATDNEMQDDKMRFGLNCDTLQEQDFGPTFLVLQDC